MAILASGLGCSFSAGAERDSMAGGTDPLNTSYTIDDRQVTLVDGRAESTAAPGSASKSTTQVWGKPEVADLNGDGQQDAALILSHCDGGTGTFYYVVAAVREGRGYRGTSGVLLGDRIDPKRIRIVDNRIAVEFLDRADGEAFSIAPSVPTQQLAVYDADSRQLAGVERAFAGEADPARMTLQMKTWYWERTTYNDDTVHTPAKPEAFSLSFQEDGQVNITTDCNTMRARSTVADNHIAFDQMIATRMYCEGSQELLFSNMLEHVGSYFFTGRGQLVLELRYDSGSMIFR